MRSISFEGDTWQRYETLRTENKKLHQILCRILKEMQRDDPATGTGKPEHLRYDLSGLWSRRLSQKARRAGEQRDPAFLKILFYLIILLHCHLLPN